MAYWIEIRCENRHKVEFTTPENGCWSHTNDGAGALYDEKSSPDSMISDFIEHAKFCGFVLTKEGWLCPNCAKQDIRENKANK